MSKTKALRDLGIDITDFSKYRAWTPDGDKYLIELFHLGYTVYEAAKEINREWSDIASRLYKLALEESIDPEEWGSKAIGSLASSLWDENFKRKKVS